MKKNLLALLVSVLLLIPTFLFAYDDPPKGIFKRQMIENNVSSYSQYSATVPFNGGLYNFLYYSSGDKIIVRVLTPKDNLTPGTMKLNVDKYDNISALGNVSDHKHQPAPVIYKSSLYCFFLANNNKLGYSVYRPDSLGWQPHVALNIPDNNHLVHGGMVAIVLQNKLCIFYKGKNGLECQWAEDDALQVWHREYLNFNNGGDNEERFGSLSAVTTYVTYKNKREEIAMLGYVDPDHKAMCARYTFENKKLERISAPTLIADNYEYQCVALAEGSVKAGGSSNGKCIQAFLKRENKDGGYCRYRILRYQTTTTDTDTWLQQENNLVDRNYDWADHELNLTVANIGVPASNTCMRQYMCLIYRGYDDCDWPLNSAWAETDSLRISTFHRDSLLTDPSRIHYIGYIEGAPPYHLNDGNQQHPYSNSNNSSIISSAEFASSGSTSTADEFKVEVGIKAKCQVKLFQGEFKGGYMGNWEKETTKTHTIGTSVEAGALNHTNGTFIYTVPVLSMDKYYIYDMQGLIVDSTYCYYIKDDIYTTETVPLKFNLNSSDPMTFVNRKANGQINLTNYPAYGSSTIDLTFDATGGVSTPSAELGVETTDKNANGGQLEFEALFGATEKEDYFFGGCYGKFEYTTTTTNVAGADIDILCNLNEPVDSADCVRMLYKAYWINKSENQNNWWVPEGAPNAKLWCLTYDVFEYVIKGGKDGPITLAAPSEEDQTGEASENSLLNLPAPGSEEIQKGLPVTSGLLQNYPNPFNGSTRIRYTIGEENPAGSMTRLSVYNLNGSRIATLVNENKAPGSYEVEWDASQFTPGVYFYSLQSGSFKDVKKLVLLK